MRKITYVILGGLVGACIAYNVMYPIKKINKGSFTDSQTEERYEYSLNEIGNSRVLFVWQEDSNQTFGKERIVDSNLDGLVDSEGILGRPIKPEKKERAQRLYSLALNDSK